MRLSKSKVLIAIFCFFLLIFSFGFLSGTSFYNDMKDYVFLTGQNQAQAVISDLELPLPKPSSISTELDNVRLDLEKIAIKKFFIIYSIVYGDQSHTAYHLYLTNLNRETLNKEAVGEIYLKTESGDIVKPVAQLPIISDFPEDQPLKWKIKIIVKFPYKTHRSDHKLIFNYGDLEFILSEISY